MSERDNMETLTFFFILYSSAKLTLVNLLKLATWS